MMGFGTEIDDKRSPIDRAAAAALATVIKAGVVAYDRARHLPGLLRLDPACLTETEENLKMIMSRLERALRAERNRGRSGHWTYDLNRHIALRQAHAAEGETFKALASAHRRCRVARLGTANVGRAHQPDSAEGGE